MKVATYTKSGNKATAEHTLDSKVFGRELSPELIKLVYNQYLSNSRTNNAKTKTRGLVSGGGRKPWRQKGTGRARTGSTRNPLWRTGGIIFGPTGEENYTIKVPKKMAKAALAQALSAQIKNICVIESLAIDTISTRTVVDLLDKLASEGTILIVVEQIGDKLERSTSNIPYVELVDYHSLSVFAVMNADTIIIEKAAVAGIETWLTPQKPTSTRVEKVGAAK